MVITIQSLRVAIQNQINGDEYAEAVFMELENLDEVRLDALDHLQAKIKELQELTIKASSKRVLAKMNYYGK